MKATLHFTLPDELAEFQDAQNGTRYSGVIEEMDNYLRARLKYEDLPENVHDALQAAREKLRDLRNDE